MFQSLKRLVIGTPIASADEGHQRLPKKVALPVFASDALSSTAYATDEILHVLLIGAGVGAFAFTKLVPIAIVVAVLLLIVITSYRQTIFAYPGGGGSYMVSKDNLGTVPSLVAASSLLVDYILTVAVSVAGGVLAIRSAFGFGQSWTVPICLLCVLLMTVANLRGLKESGALFAPPTYVYIVSLVTLIIVGLVRVFVFKNIDPIDPATVSKEAEELSQGAKGLGLMMLLRAFSSGAVALSGVEAVSDGVPAFKKPESKNAAATIVTMGAILGTCFLGISVLASHLKPIRGESDPTGIALMAEHVYGGKGALFWVMQISTFAILILAANTAYADFPRLSSFVAKDGFLPRQFANRGDRLVFSNGVIFLAVASSVLIWVFDGQISALIPLYAFGVFTGFTLSQAGMFRRHLRLKQARWKAAAALSGFGSFTTGVIALIVVVSKFTQGAWLPAVIIPLMVLGLFSVGQHYAHVKQSLAVPAGYKSPRRTHYVVVLVGKVNRGVLDAVQYARSLNPERIIALSIVQDPEEERALHQQWDDYDVPIELHTISSPYRELTRPVMAYLDEIDEERDDDIITVVIPESVTKMSSQWLHNQSAFALKARLLYRPDTVVVSVPVHIDVDADGDD
ncbi:MAG: APC family permease [Ilumatobacteraceae bacterium]|nr:APC family permease [Ilumatobacteraceae bacterium]MBP7888959.1 APC family permease [Ilumatobacteraceae bacterium]MBP8209679.1 APC family permease [Ilumatobacteraceae bacterium]